MTDSLLYHEENFWLAIVDFPEPPEEEELQQLARSPWICALYPGAHVCSVLPHHALPVYLCPVPWRTDPDGCSVLLL